MPGAWGREKWGVTAHVYSVSSGVMRMFWKTVVMAAQLCEDTKSPEVYTLKRWVLWSMNCI